MEKSESIKNLATSMAQFRKNLLKAQPSKDGKSHYGNYVTLEDLTAAVDGALPESLGYTQEATSDPNGVSITTMLFDASGEYIIYNPLSMPVQRKDAQAFGSAETYARRYSLSAAFGVSASKDDDGQQATKAAPSNRTAQQNNRQPLPVTKQQATTLNGLFEAMSKAASAPIEAVRNGYLEKLNVSQVNDLTHDGANQLISLVTAQLKKQSEKGNSND
ncbi:ERF family protein [Levilactobacillus yiduensis]|uniref:ERF family protein n=1 Tax=Levilactobacillus yiduensis TaxID=2953880 RepID=UPI002156F876|nr:ERF family protein [Levilactobacillus yiduensis]